MSRFIATAMVVFSMPKNTSYFDAFQWWLLVITNTNKSLFNKLEKNQHKIKRTQKVFVLSIKIEKLKTDHFN